MWNQSTLATGTERRGWSLSCWPQKEFGFNYLLPCFSNSITGSTSSLSSKRFKCWQWWECPLPHAMENYCIYPHCIHSPLLWFDSALPPTLILHPLVELRVVHFWAPCIPKWNSGVQNLDFLFHQRTNILSYHFYPSFSFFNCAIFVVRLII